jgi:23S rRNA pseudouridine2605 synthase
MAKRNTPRSGEGRSGSKGRSSGKRAGSPKKSSGGFSSKRNSGSRPTSSDRKRPDDSSSFKSDRDKSSSRPYGKFSKDKRTGTSFGKSEGSAFSSKSRGRKSDSFGDKTDKYSDRFSKDKRPRSSDGRKDEGRSSYKNRGDDKSGAYPSRYSGDKRPGHSRGRDDSRFSSKSGGRKSDSFGDKKDKYTSRSNEKSVRPWDKKAGDSSSSRGRNSSSFDEKRKFSSDRSSTEGGSKPPRRSGSEFSSNRGRKGGSFDDKGDKPSTRFSKGPRSTSKRDGDSEFKPVRKTSFGDKDEKFSKQTLQENEGSDSARKGFKGRTRSEKPFKGAETPFSPEAPVQTEKIRLNRYISNSGVCSRREADELITMGLISVNGKTITELGYKVDPGDVVRYEDRVLKAEKPVYLLLNKPKGFLTTTNDPQERKTVMHLVANAVKERVYPVGRLDRNTTGLLLLTNDGDLADKLMHPSYNVKKIYKVELDRPLTKGDLQKLQEGIPLEEGTAAVDDIAIVSDDGKTIGVELHIGWNRVVRRIFEALEYDVVKLDRSVYAGLDKKDLPRGHWRFLTKEEIIRLKHYK